MCESVWTIDLEGLLELSDCLRSIWEICSAFLLGLSIHLRILAFSDAAHLHIDNTALCVRTGFYIMYFHKSETISDFDFYESCSFL